MSLRERCREPGAADALEPTSLPGRGQTGDTGPEPSGPEPAAPDTVLDGLGPNTLTSGDAASDDTLHRQRSAGTKQRTFWSHPAGRLAEPEPDPERNPEPPGLT